MKDGKQLPGIHRDPVKTFEGHEDMIISIAIFPDGEKIATWSEDKTIRVWRIQDGRALKKWDVKKQVGSLIVSRDGKQVVSAEGEDDDYDTTNGWQLWVRDAETGKVVVGPLDGHTGVVMTLDISPDGGILASGSYQGSVILWDINIWQRNGNHLSCGAPVSFIHFSPTGQKLGVATPADIQIWNLDRRERLVQFNGHANFNDSANLSLSWSLDGKHLFSVGDEDDPVIRSWDTTTWTQIGDPWTGHDGSEHITRIILNPAGNLLASSSDDHTVRLWQVSTGTEVARYEHSGGVSDVAFSVDGRFVFSGDRENIIWQWEITEDVLTAAGGDPLAEELKAGVDPSRRKRKGFLDMEIPGQRRNMANVRISRSRPRAAHAAIESAADVDSLSRSRVHGVKTFFRRMRPSSDSKGKMRERRSTRHTPDVVDVPLGQATYADYVASKEDGIRPYSLLFCLSWFQKKEKKPDPPRQVYDVELMNDERDEDPLNVPIPTTTRVQSNQEGIELTPMASQSQPEAGPSHLAQIEELPRQSS